MAHKELVFGATKTFLYYTRGEDGMLNCSPLSPDKGVPDFRVTMHAVNMKKKTVRERRRVKTRKGPPPIGIGSSDAINYRNALLGVK